MAQEKLENFFKDPQLEYENMNQDLLNHLATPVYEEVMAFVQMKTDEAMDRVWGQLLHRYESLNQLYESVPEQPTKEDEQNYIKDFFRLTDPSQVSRDLQQAIKFEELEQNYLAFIQQMSTQEYGSIFKKYAYPTTFFNGLKYAMLHHINQLTRALKAYTDKIGQHALLMEDINEEQKGKSIIKGGAAVLGLMVGVPFAGAGVGALLGGADQSKINNSLTNIFKGWDAFVDQLRYFMDILKEHYQLAMLALYGGTILRANQQFHAYNLMMGQLALLSREYILTLTPRERKDTENWVKDTTNGITNLLKYRQWKEAIRIASGLYQSIHERPIVARTEIYDEKSTLYITHLYYYLAYQEALLAEYHNGNFDSFYEMTKNLYQQLPLIIKEDDIVQGFSKPGHLLFRFVKEALKRGKPDDLKVILEYSKRLADRTEIALYKGEDVESIDEFVEQMKALYVVEWFLEEDLGIKIDGDEPDDELLPPLTRHQFKQLIQIDQEIGRKDRFTKFLKKQYWKALLTVNLKGKRLLTSILLAGGLTIGGSLYAIPWSDWFAQDNNAEIYMSVTSEMAYIRAEPDIDGEVVVELEQPEELYFLQEETRDSEGRLWYYVETSNGKEGWISSNLVE